MSWRRISCDEFEEQLDIMGDEKFVYSSLTDIGGEFGPPTIETVWARKDAPDDPLLKGIRYPSETGPDYRACEHYSYREDGW